MGDGNEVEALFFFRLYLSIIFPVATIFFLWYGI